MNVTEAQAEAAIVTLKRMINAAENSNQHGENCVVAAAAGPSLLSALKEAADFIQPFNRAEALLDKIEAAIHIATGGAA